MVKRSSALPPLVLHVNPVGRQEADFHLWPVAALVLIVDPLSGPASIRPVAAAVLGLTRMESRVAVLLAEGMSIREVAAATGRKESTIRSRVKHMFARHGLSRQAELVRLVLSLAARSGVLALKVGSAAVRDELVCLTRSFRDPAKKNAKSTQCWGSAEESYADMFSHRIGSAGRRPGEDRCAGGCVPIFSRAMAGELPGKPQRWSTSVPHGTVQRGFG